MYTIDKNVAMPTSSGGPKAIYPFAIMEVGDSFSIPKEKHKSCTGAAWQHGKKHNKTFSVRKDGDNYRVWRVK